MRPTLAVTLPNYNHGRYLRQCLDAIFTQSFLPDEVIVVDDASSDDSLEILKSFQKREPNLHVLINDSNKGAMASVQRAFAATTTEYVCFQSADDIVLPGLFEKSMELLAKSPSAGLCCTDPVYFTNDGESRRIYLGWSDEPCYLSPAHIADALQGGFIFGHTSIVRKSVLLEAGGQIAELKWHSDWFANLVLAFRYGICYVPEPLAAMRECPGTFSARGRTNWQEQKEVLRFIITLLKSEPYRDVLPYFVRSSALSHFGDEVVRLVMSEPQLWDATTMMLIQEPLHNWVQGMRAVRHERNLRGALLDAQARAEGLVSDAQKDLTESRFDPAAEKFRRITKEFPNLSHGFVGLGYSELGKQNFAAARAAFEQAEHLCSGNLELQKQVGFGFFRLGDFDTAFKLLKSIRDRSPEDATVLHALAVIRCNQGHAEEALNYLEAARQVSPTDVEVLADLGKLAMVLNLKDKAESAFSSALKLQPDRADIQTLLANIKGSDIPQLR